MCPHSHRYRYLNIVICISKCNDISASYIEWCIITHIYICIRIYIDKIWDQSQRLFYRVNILLISLCSLGFFFSLQFISLIHLLFSMPSLLLNKTQIYISLLPQMMISYPDLWLSCTSNHNSCHVVFWYCLCHELHGFLVTQININASFSFFFFDTLFILKADKTYQLVFLFPLFSLSSLYSSFFFLWAVTKYLWLLGVHITWSLGREYICIVFFV